MEWGYIVLIVSLAYAAQEEHFIDVKQIVKGAIEAMSKFPMPHNGTDPLNEKNSKDFYNLLQLPADIMGKLAADAGYLDTTSPTTSGPWIVRRKTMTSSEEEESFLQDDFRKEITSQKKRKHKKNNDPTLISISDILSNVKQQLPPIPVVVKQPPTELPSSLINSANLAALPVLQEEHYFSSSTSKIQPQIVYQPIINPDGKTVYQQFLIIPGKVAPKDAEVGLRPSIEKSSFVQEMPLKPKRIMQANFSISAPTFPPQVNLFQRSTLPYRFTTTPSTSFSSSVYSEESMKSPSSYVKLASQDESPTHMSVMWSESMEKSTQQTPEPVEHLPEERSSLLTKELPDDEKHSTSIPIFYKEEAAPPKPLVKVAQTSPLRIRTIESNLRHASNANEGMREDNHEKPRTLVEENMEGMESQLSHHNRKLRKIKKPKKLLSKSRHFGDYINSIEMFNDEHHKSIRRMPQKTQNTQYLERVSIHIPYSRWKLERAHASKTSMRSGYEPVDVSMSKKLESFKRIKDVETKKRKSYKMEVLAKKRRSKSRRLAKLKKTREMKKDEIVLNDEKRIRIPQQNEMKVPMPLNRKTLQLNKLNIEETNSMKNNKRTSEYHREAVHYPIKARKRKRKNSKTSTLSLANSAYFESSLLRQHCLNIRTFAQQFGFDDVDEFSQEHCEFIENYYPHLKCDKRRYYVAECQKYY